MYKNIAIIGLITILGVSNAYTYYLYKDKVRNKIPLPLPGIVSNTGRSQNQNVEPKLEISTSTLVSATNSDSATVDFDGRKFFKELPENSRNSEIVGYFAYGAFIIRLPRWIDGNWSSQSDGKLGMSFVPREIAPNLRDFSDIVVEVATTTEQYNANTLYDRRYEIYAVDFSEVLINNEGDTRIYHIQSLNNGTVYDTYYIDGDKKTAKVTFSAKEQYYTEYSARVKELLQGISPGKAPQG